MKNAMNKLSKSKVLYYITVIFVILAVISGFLIEIFINNPVMSVVGIILCIILSLIVLYLLVGYIYRMIVSLTGAYRTKGNLFKLYKNDKLFREAVNNGVSCLFILASAFINFVESFNNYRWYFVSVSAIFFLLFIMKLYLIVNVDNTKAKQNRTITLLITLMAIANAGVVIMLCVGGIEARHKGLIIYWDALYAFVSLVCTIIALVKVRKGENEYLERFISVRLANAIFGMFALGVSMLMTFSEDFTLTIPVCIGMGVVSSVLILIIPIVKFALDKAKRKIKK